MYPPPSSSHQDGKDPDVVYLPSSNGPPVQGRRPRRVSVSRRNRTLSEAPSTSEASPAPSIHNPHNHTIHRPPVPGALQMPFDQTSMNPNSRRQFLLSVIASCKPEELLFMSETIAPLLKRDFLYQLPTELVLHVLSFVDDPKDLMHASLVSKYWYRLVRDESIWRRMCYIYGFDDCELEKQRFEREQARKCEEKQRGKQTQSDPLSDDDNGILSPDADGRDEKDADREKEKKPDYHHHHHHHHHHRHRKFSFRRYFRESFIIRMNWRNGGKLLKSHKLPIVAPDTGTVTSISLDSESVVVGFANSMIKIFSVQSGVLCRTLVGHKSGVWCVCLVSKDGHRDPEPGKELHASVQQTSSSSTPSSPQTRKSSAYGFSSSPSIIQANSSEPLERPRHPKTPKKPKERSSKKSSSSNDKEKKKAAANANANANISEGVSNLSIHEPDPDVTLTSPSIAQSPQPTTPSGSRSARSITTLDLNERKGVNKILPFQSQEHLISPSMQRMLGIDPHDSDESSGADESSSSSSSSEAINVNVEEQARHRVRKQPSKMRAEHPHPHSARSHSHHHRHHQHHEESHPEDYEELNNINTHRMTLNAPGSSRGWGQPNPIIVSGGCDKTVRVWDAISGQCIYILHGHTSTIRAMRVLHHRPIAVTGSRDNTVRIWDIQLGRCLRVLEGHLSSVRCLDVHDNRVVSGSYDNTCRLWNIDTGQCLHILIGHFHQVYTVAFDGVRVVSGGLDTTVRVWNAETGQCIALLQGHTALVCEIQLSPTILATGGSDGRVITFSLKTYEVLYRLVPHESSVTSLQLDENFLVTGGNDGRVKLYETQTGEYIRDLTDMSDNVWKVAFGKETISIMCRRGAKTVVEIWTLGPRYMKRRHKDRDRDPNANVKKGDGAASVTS